MATYVYSTGPNAKVTHYGTVESTACYRVFLSSFKASDTPPPDRPMCKSCVRRLAQTSRSEARTIRLEQNLALRREAAAQAWARRNAARDAALVAVLAEGLTNHAVMRRLGLPSRTLCRRTSAAMRRAGARTMFEWGYKTGRAEVERG